MESLAGGIRSHLIDIGVEAFGSDGMQRVFLPSRLSVVEVGRAKSAGDLVRLYVVADRPAPEVGPDAVTLFLSLSGEESLVSWEVEGRLHYRESLGGGWSEVHTLAPGLDGEEAKRVLRDRLRPH